MNSTLDEADRTGLKQREHLGLIRDILDEVGAEQNLFDALNQAQADNDRYMSGELQPEFLEEAEVRQNSASLTKLTKVWTDRLVLRKALRRLDEVNGPSRKLDRELYVSFGLHEKWKRVPNYTSSNDAIDKLIAEILPGFWETSGLSNITGIASIGPEYKAPYAELQEAAWPETEFDGGFSADLGPEGGGDHRKCFARLHCILQALIARRNARPAS